ncbi:hypothetical protein ACFFX0_15620 [Citricoccus parietis]|uniref:Uncharacterized protein n=1 Tax=Citricoccus parietis TaxID=592307 RepID=A0ABV5G0T9_9MICC
MRHARASSPTTVTSPAQASHRGPEPSVVEGVRGHRGVIVLDVQYHDVPGGDVTSLLLLLALLGFLLPGLVLLLRRVLQ